MKTVMAVLAMVLMATGVMAAPFLQSNVQASATSYTIAGGPPFIPTTVATTNGQMRVDLVNYTVGTWPVTVRACKTDPIWGVQCSPNTAYTLTCPSPTGGLTAPTLTIVP
jgi:hypothetical protein